MENKLEERGKPVNKEVVKSALKRCYVFTVTTS